jgi:hypothetical protein
MQLIALPKIKVLYPTTARHQEKMLVKKKIQMLKAAIVALFILHLFSMARLWSQMMYPATTHHWEKMPMEKI